MASAATTVIVRFQTRRPCGIGLEVVGEAGAGLVKVTMLGNHNVRRVELDESLMEDDKDMIEDLLAAACNDAVRRVAEETQERMGKVTGGMQLPPGMKMPF